jgi:hypothetical protein
MRGYLAPNRGPMPADATGSPGDSDIARTAFLAARIASLPRIRRVITAALLPVAY